MKLPSSTIPVGIQVTEGSYIEEATGKPITIGTNTLTAVLPILASSSTPVHVVISPLTEIAYKRVQGLVAVSPSTTLTQSVKNANYAVSQAFGISDIIGVIPNDSSVVVSQNQSGTYALVLAALSAVAASNKTDSIAVTKAFSESFKTNGNFVPSAVAVKDTQGVILSLTTPTLEALTQTVSQIGTGALVMQGLAVPSSYIAPVMNTYPPSVAPATYVVAAGTSNSLGLDLSSYTAEQAAQLISSQIASLSNVQILGLSTTFVGSLSSRGVSGLTTSHVAVLSLAQLGAMGTGGASGLASSQVAILTTGMCAGAFVR